MKGPKFVNYFGPVVAALKKLGGSGRPSEVRAIVARELGISEHEQSELLPSGAASRFDNAVAWARFYLSKAGYIDSSRHGVWTLTGKGRALTEMSHTQALDVFRQVQGGFIRARASGPAEEKGAAVAEEEIAPEGAVSPRGESYRQELLEVIGSLTPSGFERFAQRLLRESGFQEVAVTGRAGDGGIDGIGILQVNPFVSFKVLFQCKRYSGAVGPGQIRDFRGAMMGRADKGIMITTGSFTVEAKREAVRDGVPQIELVDAEKLLTMLEQLELGLTPTRAYEVDRSFFDQFK